MNASPTGQTLSSAARNFHWLLDNLIEEVPGVRSVAVVSSDGLLLLSSDSSDSPDSPDSPGSSDAWGASAPDGRGPGPHGRAGDIGGGSPDGAAGGLGRGGAGRNASGANLATVVSGIGSLALGAAKVMNAGGIKQTMIAMREGTLFIMSISDGSLLGVHAHSDCDISVVAYHMALFVGRAGHVLTPELRTELRNSMELEK